MSLASLAAYASSDESESEPEEAGNVNSNQLSQPAPGPTPSSSSSQGQLKSGVDLIEDEEDDLVAHATVTSSLPQAEGREDSVSGSLFQADDVVDDVPLASKIQAEKPPKKNQPVKISIPSLSQFKDEEEEEPAAKKMKPSQKGSGLFSLLPPPKAATTKELGRALVPHSVSRPAAPRRAAPAPPRVPPPAPAAADSDDEEGGGGDFFSLSEEGPSLPALPVGPAAGPLTFSEREQEAAAAARRRSPSPEPMEGAPPPTAAGSQWPQSAAAQLDMPAEALQHLRGRRGRREAPEDIQFIDVNQDDILPDRDEWMTKQLTEEKVVRRPQKSADDPTSQQRRKHQITYLAHQAKEREVELKNEWAQNRATKNAYRTKYGF
ncbi:proline-rich protein PRCC-like isoform X1 [Amphibalanus amphitrite]|uniref:proline-rich protein PRCC-like isoform X1 n=2 Tax=Amphibalanus amphitrite TaxID=1232801 RepID=UPI001C9055C3|nr:proline-rich protein PRCC-like isoform X1 [Amphibalanus amphitrite]XP_043188976.1 proline-rich protein PRCC-like isoform X1 [Amphibalanus amphitrite]XP_043188977.1 proline-rich protein PRCC-like isoform X1 [Amphibalanus amphitrite]XP_043188978.1 proline-rich protein PRCC-like isoform X1 [Amphibalanus amphitrite]XP_043188979.1 proline-rich protein PRCC-like isoform X1 [Amphibalanus amphitrite]